MRSLHGSYLDGCPPCRFAGCGDACASSAEGTQHLRAIDRLRYAEEHAVRYAAVDLAERRNEVKRLITTLRPSAGQSL